ncbi:methyl-accepting chemotaxis protein [Aeromonas simiae]|uniref:Methyl-accepting chemotaxis protein n=1 Tax=Aeromonas simiae TaxID=218936 RepID=A0A5J6WSI1_9GAMM|nr:methyl-accepting chemotaxis protein [Aeromonas simiae]QFI54096.1 methyl-accepting chemotaxis protein [Aeromonas simiae]
MLKNLSIGQKLGAGFAVLALMIISLVLLLLAQLSRLHNDTASLAEDILPSVASSGKINAYLLDARRMELNALLDLAGGDLAGYERFNKKFNDFRDEFEREFAHYRTLTFSSPEERAMYDKLGMLLNRYYQIHEYIETAVQQGDNEKITSLRNNESRVALLEAIEYANNLREMNETISSIQAKESEETYIQGRNIGYGAGIFTTILVIILSTVLTQQIRRPIAALLIQIRRVAQGDLSASIDRSLFRHDELGAVAKGLDEMQDSLRTLVSEVSASVVQLSSAAEEISMVAGQSAGNMNNQQYEINQLSAAMDEMRATVHEVSRNTSDAADSAGHANQSAEAGAKTVHDSINRIEKVEEVIEEAACIIEQLGNDSQNIGMVLDVIHNIADQTNLLALNAAIEAARAGEHGRGFAVVADEVRSLVRRTQDSTSRINDIISELRQRAELASVTMKQGQGIMKDTVASARQAGSAIGEINGAVTTISEMSVQIAAATEQQSAVTEELNRNMVNITRASEEVATGANQMAQACNELTQLASQLHGMVSRFQV